ncbi:MAG: glycoside hydrolase family 31 protein, partial [Bacteroidota bacterium]
GERRLWKRTPEEMDIIRKYSWLHTELLPYIYHYVVSAHKGGRRLQTPIKIGKYQYLFGDDFLIVPIYRDSQIREVVLPDGQWRYFFDDREVLEGPSAIERSFSLEEYPVYVKEGAIVPLDVKRAYTGLGDYTSKGYVTVLMYPKGSNSFTYFQPDTLEETHISYEQEKNGLRVFLEGNTIPHILRIHSERKPKKVSLNNREVDAESWNYNRIENKIIIKTRADQGKITYAIVF